MGLVLRDSVIHRYVAGPVFDDLPPPLQAATTWAPLDATVRVDPKVGSPAFTPYDIAQLAGDSRSLIRAEHLPVVPAQGVFLVPGARGTAEIRHETDAYLLRVRVDRTLLVSFKTRAGPWEGASALLSFLAEGALVDRGGAPLRPEETHDLPGGGTWLRYPTPPPFVGLASGLLVYASPLLLACALPLLIDHRPDPLA